MDPVKHFDLLFGGVFATIGTVALVAGIVAGVILTRRPPKARVSWLFAALPVSMGLLFATIGVVFGSSALAQIQQEERLLASGVTIRATVVDVERTGSRLNGRHLWQIRYEYRDAGGRRYEGVSSKMERLDAQQFRAGDRAFVRYDPAEPTASVWLGHNDVASVAFFVSERCICYRWPGA